MKLRTLGIILVLILLAVFLIINWTALSTVMTVNLVYREIQAPLGVIVVVIVVAAFAVVVLCMFIYTVWQQASVSLEIRSAYKEARTARHLADEADKSRVTALHTEMNERLTKIETMLSERTEEMLSLVRTRSGEVDAKLAELASMQADYQAKNLQAIRASLSEIEAKMLPPLPPADEEPSKAEKDAKDTAEKKELFKDLF